jgi:hypothetical protein
MGEYPRESSSPTGLSARMWLGAESNRGDPGAGMRVTAMTMGTRILLCQGNCNPSRFAARFSAARCYEATGQRCRPRYQGHGLEPADWYTAGGLLSR